MVQRGYCHVGRALTVGLTCHLPQPVLAAAGWREGERIRLNFGSAWVQAEVRSAAGSTWRISSRLLGRLRLLARRWYYQLDSARRTIRFGPLIGILTTWQITPYFRSVMRAAARRGMMAVVIHVSDIRPGARYVMAHGYQGGAVRSLMLPWPNVVYNRIPNRGGERLVTTRVAKRALRLRGIPVFNWKFFHKLVLYRLLERDEIARAYLPETYPLRAMSQVGRFLRKYPMVYLKPNGGSKGHGIVKINRLPGGGYAVAFRRGNQNYRLISGSWAEAEMHARRGMQRRSYIMQEGLMLARYRGRPFDIRVTLYKNGDGDWIPSGPAAKIAGRGSVTTHVVSGGRVVPLNQALRVTFGDRAEEIRQRIYEASVTLAQALERVTRSEMGELGLDIGVTAQGRVAMFEANSKPGRAIFSPGWAARDRRTSLICLCDYAARLAWGTDGGVEANG